MNENNKGSSLKAAGRYLYQEGTVYIILVALIIFFSIFNPKFLSSAISIISSLRAPI